MCALGWGNTNVCLSWQRHFSRQKTTRSLEHAFISLKGTSSLSSTYGTNTVVEELGTLWLAIANHLVLTAIFEFFSFKRCVIDWNNEQSHSSSLGYAEIISASQFESEIRASDRWIDWQLGSLSSCPRPRLASRRWFLHGCGWAAEHFGGIPLTVFSSFGNMRTKFPLFCQVVLYIFLIEKWWILKISDFRYH